MSDNTPKKQKSSLTANLTFILGLISFLFVFAHIFGWDYLGEGVMLFMFIYILSGIASSITFVAGLIKKAKPTWQLYTGAGLGVFWGLFILYGTTIAN